MYLADLLIHYQTKHRLSDGHQTLQRSTVRQFGLWLGHDPDTADLDCETVSLWIAHLEPLYSRWTIAGHRSRLLTLWRFAAATRAANAVGSVRAARPPTPMPEAWTIEEVGRLLDAADAMLEGSAWFHAAILAAYETGLRRSDLCGLHRRQIAEDGTVQLRQRKTEESVVVRMRPATARLVLALPGDQPLAIPWGCRKYTRLWQELRTAARVAPGGLQRLRRTGASYVARDYGTDAAREFLGHRTDGMVRHYIDRRIVVKRRIYPPMVG